MAFSSSFDFQYLLRPSERVTVSLPCRIRTGRLVYTKAEALVVVGRKAAPETAA